MRHLSLARCGLRSLAHLHQLTRLQYLSMAGNRITDVADLDRLSQLVSLQELMLAGEGVA